MNSLHRIKRVVLAPVLLATVFLLQSCNSFLDVDVRHAASEGQQWNALDDTRAALMGVYGLMRAALAENNSYWAYGELRMGDFTVYDNEDLKLVVNNELNASRAYMQSLSDWRRFYAVINAASVFIEKAPQVVEKDRAYSEANLKYDVAQVRLLRAFAYFYMVRLWGDVPLLTQSYDNGSFEEMPCTDSRMVLNYVKDEILNAITYLPFGYGTDVNKYYNQKADYWKGILLNKISAYAVLAHVCAWEANYSDAATYSAYVMEHVSDIAAKYVSIEDLVSTIGFFSMKTGDLNGGKIVSFNFPYEHYEATQSGHLEQLTLASPFVNKSHPEIYVSRDSLFAIFDDLKDKRFGYNDSTKNYYSNYISNMSAEVPLFTKIKVVQDGQGTDNDFAVFGSSIVFTRLEEIALLRAEALAALNRGAEAITYYNEVRSKRGLALTTFNKNFGGDNQKLLAAIFEERRKELLGEGWRWFDMVRRERLLGDNPVMGKLIAEDGIYWPIAQNVLSSNTRLKQNKYWE